MSRRYVLLDSDGNVRDHTFSLSLMMTSSSTQLFHTILRVRNFKVFSFVGIVLVYKAALMTFKIYILRSWTELSNYSLFFMNNPYIQIRIL